MELFFDTYETGQDVRDFTAPIVALLDKQPQTMAPPVLLFSLGRVQFRCVLVDAGQRFTMFLPRRHAGALDHVGAAAGVRRGRRWRSSKGCSSDRRPSPRR